MDDNGLTVALNANIRSKLWTCHTFVVDFCIQMGVWCENSFD